MLDDMLTLTMLNVLEYDGLIEIERGVARTTVHFQQTMATSKTARRAKREKRNLDLRACIAEAMHARHGKYLSSEEMQRLVDAMLPIAAAEQQKTADIFINVLPAARSKSKS